MIVDKEGGAEVERETIEAEVRIEKSIIIVGEDTEGQTLEATGNIEKEVDHLPLILHLHLQVTHPQTLKKREKDRKLKRLKSLSKYSFYLILL